MKLFYVLCMIFLSCLFYANASYGQKLPFQGRLLQNGTPVTGQVSIIFSIDTIWSETHEAVTVTDGLYDVVLGSIAPLPSDLFQHSPERELSITIGGTPLTPVTIYAAMSNNSIQRKLLVDADQTRSDTAIYFEISGGSDSTSYTGVLSTGNSIGTNVGVRGNALSTATNANYQVGTWGRAAGDGSAYHYGVIGQAVGKGPRNMGLYGVASGTGNGETSLDSGSYNQGVFGVALNNAWGNVGVYGEASGTVGSDNVGVAGWSFAGDETTENKGIVGWAKGTGINKGVMGIANGGVENWAGWFEGNVALLDTSYLKRIELNSNAGNILGRGPNSSINWMMSSVGHGGNYGSFNLRDSSGVAKVWAQAYPLLDGSAYGLFTLQGPSEGAIQAGFKGWETDSLVNLPWLTFEGNIPNKSLIHLEVMNNDRGDETGFIRFETTEDGRNVHMNSSELIFNGPNKPNIQIGAKVWENPDLGMIAIKDSTWGNLVGFEASINDNGQLFGQGFFHTNQDPRHINLSSHGYNMHGPQRQAMGIGFQNWSDSNLAYIHMYDSTFAPVIYLEPRANGPIHEGVLELVAQGGSRRVNLSSNGFTMYGQTSQIARIGNFAGQPNFGEDRSFLWLFGSDQSTGGYSKVNLEVQNDGKGNYGTLNLSNHLANSTDQGGSTIFLNGFDGSARFDGTVTVEGGTLVTSDKRYKQDVVTLQNSLHNVSQLRGVSYLLKKDLNAGKQIGVIAQEVEKVYPEFVKTNEEGFKSVNYAQMVAVLIEAVKELNFKVEQLETKNSTLTNENTELKTQLETEMKSIKNRMEQLEALLSGKELNPSLERPSTNKTE